MSQSLNSCLQEITESLGSISNRNFKHPGIFHNAVVGSMLSQGGKKEFVKLLRDGEPNEELSLFQVDSQKRSIMRRDKKRGVYDYIVEREAKIKRNRRMGIPDPKPIIQIPKDFYLSQHEKVINSNTNRNGRNSFIFQNTTGNLGSTNNAFGALHNKFKNDKMTAKLLEALQNGSVLAEEDDSENINHAAIKRRKTMFVEDFPIDLIIKVLDEINNMWSLSEFKEEFNTLKRSASELSMKIKDVQDQLEIQEDEISNMDSYTTPSASISKLIEVNRQEIADLEKEIKDLEDTNSKQN
ncbi:similar to Saccharomyces cerevisiae YKR037C SPC34 Essential subunit of the Dam1 complex (aka DASH complex) [Maudiozyma saulgeensis]|uniref:DASH complex subunit SPC34 n=1 Tax=Maudiozyma saulgeensis TaxID=1789683 RepID=A0A1X7R0Y4_9SACH|nr:similar to Saccharomyces cerevisiae YKR037C SPC34 Essential subunit of the Dam1 complex (aka DASH complex) [Kazachstania saulgeensis]